jgi:hypothetical protein
MLVKVSRSRLTDIWAGLEQRHTLKLYIPAIRMKQFESVHAVSHSVFA